MSGGLGRALGIAVEGVGGHVIEVEADIGQSIPAFILLGLPDSSLMEARERIRSAAKNSGFALPARKLTVNLLPAGMPKRGPGFDLAIVVAALIADGKIPENPPGFVFLGELALDGRLRPVTGILPAVIAAVKSGNPVVICPRENHREAELVPGAQVRSYDTLAQVLCALGARGKAGELSTLPSPTSPSLESSEKKRDLSEVVGQEEATHAAVVSAVGGHHMLLVGPPGSGKTMIAERLPGILPSLENEQSLEVSALHSVCFPLGDEGLVRTAPFISPHHTATPAAILGGGGRHLRPGAVSMAHHGVLFLDEACEFDRRALEGLRQPLEEGQIAIFRAAGSTIFPAKFQLVLAANPCPCGSGRGDGRDCSCSSLQRRRYFSRISGPIMDRVDIRVRVKTVGSALIGSSQGKMSTQEAKERVSLARKKASNRWKEYGFSLNSHIPASLLRTEAALAREHTRLLDTALEEGRLSARGYGRILRLAWSLADLEEAPQPYREHIAQAASLRRVEGVNYG